MVWRFLKRLGIKPPHDPEIPLLGIYPEETKIEKDTFNPIFITDLVTIVRTWEQPRCPSTDEWIKKLWYIYTREYYSAIKMNPYFLIFLCIHCIQSVERQDVRNAKKKGICISKANNLESKAVSKRKL